MQGLVSCTCKGVKGRGTWDRGKKPLASHPGGRSANIWQLTARSLDARPSLPRSLQVAKVPPLPPICGRQTHHLSLICFRIGSGEVTKEEGGTNGVKTSCGLTAPGGREGGEQVSSEIFPFEVCTYCGHRRQRGRRKTTAGLQPNANATD